MSQNRALYVETSQFTNWPIWPVFWFTFAGVKRVKRLYLSVRLVLWWTKHVRQPSCLVRVEMLRL